MISFILTVELQPSFSISQPPVTVRYFFHAWQTELMFVFKTPTLTSVLTAISFALIVQTACQAWKKNNTEEISP